MGKFGLFNPSTLRWSDDQEENNNNHRPQQQHGHHRDDPSAEDPERRPMLHVHSMPGGVSNNNSNNNTDHGPPLTIEYGSVSSDPAMNSAQRGNGNDGNEETTQGEEKSVRWHDYDDNNDLDYERPANDRDNDQDATFSATGSTGTAGTMGDSSTIPSMTAAFQAVENRTILLYCLLYLVMYLTIAVIAYSYVFEQWTIIDSLFFAVATFTTCGYGDHEPETTGGKIFTICFAIYGVIILGVFIAIFGSFISEAQIRAMKRFQRNKQSQMMETLFYMEDDENENNEDELSGSKNNSKKDGAQINGDSEKQTSDRSNETTESEEIEKTGFWRDHVSMADDIYKVVQAEFPLIGLVAVMSLILGMREGWDPASTLYFCIMAATTTGYGDYTPTNQADKLYCIILYPIAVAVFGEVLGRIATVYIQRKQRISQKQFLHRSLTMCDIRNMDADGDGRVDLAEFMAFMLIALQKVDRETIDELKSIFRRLDDNGNGYLEEDDLVELAEDNYLPTLELIREELEESSAVLDQKLLARLPPVELPRAQEAPTSDLRHRRSQTIL